MQVTLQALRDSERQLRAIFDRAQDAMVLMNDAGTFVDVNTAACELLGTSRDQLLGRRLAEFAPSGDDLKTLWGSFRQTGSIRNERPIIRPDGTVLDVEFTATADVVLGRHLWVIRDVSERKRAERNLQRLKQAVEQSAESIIITDPQGTIRYVNPAFEALTGYSRAEAIGNNPRMLKSGVQDQEFYRELWSALERGEVWRGSFVNKRKDGTLFEEEATISPVHDEQGTLVSYVAVSRYVGRERQLEEQLHQAQRLEAMGRLAGGVAHDFNNLLTAILGYAHSALSKLSAQEPLRRNLEEIIKRADQAGNLTHQLLTYSSHQALEPRVLDLNALLGNMDGRIQGLIGEHIAPRMALAADLWRIFADPSGLERVVLNLVINARDAMPGGGKLTIETANVELDQSYARDHIGVNPGPHVLLAVADSGIGLDPETKAHLFEPFYTTKAQAQGGGLGLPTVYGIVKQSGGFIWAYSETGQGTVFKIYLPKTNQALAVFHPAATRPAPTGSETILVVEDDDAVRQLICETLGAHGYAVLEASSGEQALLVAQTRRGPIDLLLTDVVLTGIGGPEVAQRLSEQRPNTKILYMSGYTDQAIVHHGILAQKVHFIQKPFSPIALARKIREVLANM
jgi:PAS domain S-box-containing protein